MIAQLVLLTMLGFARGTCYEYPVFSVRRRSQLRLIERPLVVMDASLFGKHYMSLGYDEARKVFGKLCCCCRIFGGVFCVLWHNSSLAGNNDKRFYVELIEESHQ